MPLSGGAADKLGNRYELLWTVQCMAQVLAGEADAIRLEPPGEEGKGVEFVLTKDDRSEFHQVKGQQAGKGRWSIADLSDVLRNFQIHLEREANAICVFVSQEAAPGLSELADRARSSASTEEFETDFLTSVSSRRDFADVRRLWDRCNQSAWELLRRIDVRTLDDRSLEAFVASLLDPLVQGNPRNVDAALMRHALERVHQTLDANTLWAHLSRLGHPPTDWGLDKSVTLAVREATDRYLANDFSPLLRISRAETEQVVRALTDPQAPARIAFLTGEAGTGKSGVAMQVVEQIRALGWPVLAFRLDRLEPVAQPEQLAPSLGLPGSPAAVLAAVARGADSLLVLDQLDAVSTISGRSPQFFHCFDTLVQQTSAHPRLHVLVVCRSFDLNEDSRLRQLRSRYQTSPDVPVGRLSPESIRQAVAELGLPASNLNDRQIELLSLPLNLVLLAETARSGGCKALDFVTALDLYDRFWTAKQERIRERRGEGVRWREVISLLCDQMSRKQALSVPWDRLLEFEGDANAMVSEHVLRRNDRRVSFFHESFFDYAFARLFAAQDGRLPDLVLDGEQHLFRRAQIRQVLIYRRASGDNAGFLRDLNWLLTADGVRFHLRQTGLLVLAGLPNPQERELGLVQSVMTTFSDQLASWARRVLFGSVGWLRILHDRGVLAAWLVRDGPERDFALRILSRWVEEEPERVAVLLEPYIKCGEEWHWRIWAVVGWHAGFIRSERGWALIRSLLAVSSKPDWHFYRGWSKAAPERCCDALALHIRGMAKINSEALRQIGQRDMPWRDVAGAAPAAFLNSLRDVVLDLLDLFRLSSSDDRLPHPDEFWWHGVPRHSEAVQLFEATALALGRLGHQDPQDFRRHLSVLSATDWQSAHLIILKAFAQTLPPVAADAARYLIDVFQRYPIGDEEALFWTMCDAIAATAPHWNDTEYVVLEQLILELRPKWERSPKGYKTRGRAQRQLLEALPDRRLSARAKRRLQEWQRKPTTRATRPWVVRGGQVKSPLPETAVQRMNDHQWLGAISRYADEHESVWLDDEILGGARQLSSELQKRVKHEPIRFASLCLQFPTDINSCYFNAVLWGLAEAEDGLALDLLTSALRRCHNVPGRPCGQWIAELVQKNATRDLPDEVINILAWYGLNDPDPQSDLWREDAESGEKWYGGDILGHAINTVRGTVAHAVASLIFADSKHIQRLSGFAERLVRDPTLAVRACAAEICTALLIPEPALALRLFQDLIDCDELLLGTQPIERFFWYALRDHFPTLRPVVERMLASADAAVAQAGARLACVTAFDVPEAVPLAKTALAGSSSLRLGAAQVYSANLISGRDRSTCEAALQRLFDDADPDVRSASIQFLYGISAEEMPVIEPLLHALINSSAFTETGHSLFRLLERTPGYMPTLLLAAVDRFLATSGRDAADVSTGAALTASEAGDLLIRAYSQADDEDVRRRCLDLIDGLLGQEAYGVERALELLYR
jgi:hypothetical protein